MRTWQKVVLGVFAVAAFVATGIVVYTVVTNAVSREELCQAVNKLNTIERAKTLSDKKQTRGLHIKGISHEQLRHARRLDDRFINQLDKAVCGLTPKPAAAIERPRKTTSKPSAPPAPLPPSRRGSGGGGLQGVAQPPSPPTTSLPPTTSSPSGTPGGSGGGSGGGNPPGSPPPPAPGPPPNPSPPPPAPAPPPKCTLTALGIRVCLPPL